MYIILDSGSTKTEMLVRQEGKADETLIFPGINPFYQTEEEIAALLFEHIDEHIQGNDVEETFFYGAGCSFPEKKAMVANALKKRFPNSKISVENDLLAASRALFQDERGIACIMGTGSNSCLYNGKEIEQNVSPLGFILGDEGSGAVIGKKFVADCLKNQMPQEIHDTFFEQRETSVPEVMERVYKKPFPNRYLASVCRFIYGYRETDYVQNLIRTSFTEFFVRNIRQYPITNEKLGFVGSIAHYFSQELTQVAQEQGYEIGLILKQPMAGLAQYHEMKKTTII
ncbi:MAG: ATPase [Paludibacteraceae bacterium]|nr:ATPase [Paludibacteraceae bacterium]